jgi:hypothetical protein
LTQLALVAECALPGCERLSDVPGAPCPECRALFDGSLGGWRIRPAPGEPETAEQVAERKSDARAAQRAIEEPERRRNQRGWLCEERRTCTRTPTGWECDACRELAG